MSPFEVIKSVPSRARELHALLGGRGEAVPRLRRFARKLPALARGLRLTQKSNRDEPLSIGHYIARNARMWPHRTALLFEDRRYTHREVDEQSNRWAHALAARGIRKGDA